MPEHSKKRVSFPSRQAPSRKKDGDGSAFDQIISACERLEADLPEGVIKEETKEIQKLAGTLQALATKTELLAGSALRLVESDLPMKALETVLDDAKTLVGAERGHILICLPDYSSYDRIASDGLECIMSRTELHIADALSRRVYETDEALLNPDIGSDPQFSNLPGIDAYLNRSILVVPLIIEVEGKTERIGTIYLDADSEKRVFSDTDCWLMQSFASLTALSIRNVRLTAALRLAYQDTVTALVKALEAKDVYTRGHSERVAEYTERCGKRFALGAARLQILYSAALLHDIGKIGLSESTLNKPTGLTADEYDHIRKHPEISAAILMGLTFLTKENDILKQHYERYDGTGYPNGLKGDEISLEGSIIQVADAWDAMTSKRIHKSEFNIDKALDELRKNAGSQFNPRVVEVFSQMIREEGLLPITELDDD